MRKKDVINFAPKAENRRKKTPGYVPLIIILCLVAFAVSVFLILAANDFDPGKALGAREPETELSDQSVTLADETDAQLSDEAVTADAVNFLFLCSSENELTFCQLISADPATGKIKIKPLALDYMLEADGTDRPLSEVFARYSYAQITEAFSGENFKISRYVHISEDNFKRLIGILGGVNVEVDGNYDIQIDAVKYSFAPGAQDMTADMFFRYMKYAGEGELKLRLQANASAAVFRQYFTLENFNKGENFFSSLINLVETNITAFDYSAAQSVLASMLARECEIAVVS